MRRGTIFVILIAFSLVSSTSLNVMYVHAESGLFVSPSYGPAGIEVDVSVDIKAYFYEKYKDASVQELWKRDTMWEQYKGLHFKVILNPDVGDIDDPSTWYVIGEASVADNGYLSGYAIIPDDAYSSEHLLVAVYQYIDQNYLSSWSGIYSVTGDSNGDSNGSNGCLVATATFGSELSPQVQFLRHFRDNKVLNTFAGRSFMEAFNGFYYSWSPNIANTIRASTGIGTVMKGLLYPLIGALHVSEGIFTALNFNSELGVVAAGFMASVLLAAIYLTPLTFLLSYIRKYRPSKFLIYAMGLIWLVSLTTIGLAELTQTSSLMITATGTFVLSTMGLTVLTTLHQIPKLMKILQN
jgi:peptide/nickel transport system substrate-binding protein